MRRQVIGENHAHEVKKHLVYSVHASSRDITAGTFDQLSQLGIRERCRYRCFRVLRAGLYLNKMQVEMVHRHNVYLCASMLEIALYNLESLIDTKPLGGNLLTKVTQLFTRHDLYLSRNDKSSAEV